LKSPRPTVKGLMVIVAVIGVAIAALIRPYKFWAIVLSLLQVTLCLTAVLGLVFRRGPERAFWIGFALFGWAYFILTVVLFWQHDVVNSPMSFPRAVGESLVVVYGFLMALSLGDRGKMAEMMAAIVALVMEVDDNSRFLVACSLVGLVFAVLGGLIARAFYFSEAASVRPSDPSSTVA
jgi:hypothetical protein